jgi:hypothetical protein
MNDSTARAIVGIVLDDQMWIAFSSFIDPDAL